MNKSIETSTNYEPLWTIDSQEEKILKKNLNDLKFNALWTFASSEESSNSKITKYTDKYWNKYLHTKVEKDGIIIHYTLFKDIDEKIGYFINIDYELEEWDPRTDEYRSNDDFIRLNESQTEKFLEIFKIK